MIDDIINDISNFIKNIITQLENLYESNGPDILPHDYDYNDITSNLYNLYYQLILDQTKLSGLTIGVFNYPNSFNINIDQYSNYIIKISLDNSNNDTTIMVNLYCYEKIAGSSPASDTFLYQTKILTYQSLINQLNLIRGYVEEYVEYVKNIT